MREANVIYYTAILATCAGIICSFLIVLKQSKITFGEVSFETFLSAIAIAEMTFLGLYLIKYSMFVVFSMSMLWLEFAVNCALKTSLLLGFSLVSSYFLIKRFKLNNIPYGILATLCIIGGVSIQVISELLISESYARFVLCIDFLVLFVCMLMFLICGLLNRPLIYSYEYHTSDQETDFMDTICKTYGLVNFFFWLPALIAKGYMLLFIPITSLWTIFSYLLTIAYPLKGTGYYFAHRYSINLISAKLLLLQGTQISLAPVDDCTRRPLRLNPPSTKKVTFDLPDDEMATTVNCSNSNI